MNVDDYFSSQSESECKTRESHEISTCYLPSMSCPTPENVLSKSHRNKYVTSTGSCTNQKKFT